MSHGRDRLWRAEFAAQAAVLGAEVRLAPQANGEGVENFRYFGSPCPVQHKKMFPRLRDEIERLRRGHRVNHDLKLYAELVCLKEQLWKVHSPIASTPIPSQPDGRCDCQDDAVECGG